MDALQADDGLRHDAAVPVGAVALFACIGHGRNDRIQESKQATTTKGQRTSVVVAHADVVADHVGHDGGHQVRLVRVDVDADADGTVGADGIGDGHAGGAAGEGLAAEQLRRVLHHFVGPPRQVVGEVAQSQPDVLRPAQQRLVLAGPRLDVHHRHARLQRLEILSRPSKTHSVRRSSTQRLRVWGRDPHGLSFLLSASQNEVGRDPPPLRVAALTG